MARVTNIKDEIESGSVSYITNQLQDAVTLIQSLYSKIGYEIIW